MSKALTMTGSALIRSSSCFLRQVARSGTFPNIRERVEAPKCICVLPGSSGKVIIVGAHFDHVSEGDGVVDNWSGASLLPSPYQAVKNEPRKHTYIFIGFTDEEKGEVGSHSYAQRMTKEEVAATDAMVNMDTLEIGRA